MLARAARAGHAMAAARAVLPAAAETPTVRMADPAGTFAFVLENDTFSGRDRFYTNGFIFAWWSAPQFDRTGGATVRALVEA